MALVKPVIFQIAGYQNSGKTTFISRLINALTKEDLLVATIKHHGHGGKPDLPENKDSSRHIAAGAMASLVEGNGHILLQAEAVKSALEDQIALMSFFQPDIILIEGHKKADYDKALIIRDRADLELFGELSNIKLLLSRDSNLTLQLKDQSDLPVFAMDDESGLDWLISYLRFRLRND